jgi:hypothetical protein
VPRGTWLAVGELTRAVEAVPVDAGVVVCGPPPLQLVSTITSNGTAQRILPTETPGLRGRYAFNFR